jgi:hypothetical protein
LNALHARKRELLLESELNRQVLQVECARLALETDRLRRGYGLARGAWIAAAPLAGFLLARKRPKAAGAVAKGTLLFTALRAGWKVWSALRDGRSRPRSER